MQRLLPTASQAEVWRKIRRDNEVSDEWTVAQCLEQ